MMNNRDEMLKAMREAYNTELSKPPSAGAGDRAWQAALTAALAAKEKENE